MEGERVKVTDVSSLVMRNMISSLPVIQTYKAWHPSSERFKGRRLFVQASVRFVSAVKLKNTTWNRPPNSAAQLENKVFKGFFFSCVFMLKDTFPPLNASSQKKTHTERAAEINSLDRKLRSLCFFKDWEIRRSVIWATSCFCWGRVVRLLWITLRIKLE